jgi:hypothetical protein
MRELFNGLYSYLFVTVPVVTQTVFRNDCSFVNRQTVIFTRHFDILLHFQYSLFQFSTRTLDSLRPPVTFTICAMQYFVLG